MLSRHALIRTQDLDDAREQVARVFCPHGLTTTSADGRIRLVHNRFQLNGLALNFVDYGSSVRIVPGELSSFYLVQIPLAGSATVRSGVREVHSTPSLAAVPNATEPLDMVWHKGSPHLVVFLPRVTVDAALESLVGRPIRVPLRFELGLDLTTPAALAWRAMIDLLVADAETEGPSLHPVVRAQLEDVVVLALLTQHPHNYFEAIALRSAPAAPRAIRLAMELCDQAGMEPLTVTALAAAVGLSVRGLQDGFRKHAGLTPMQYLRDARLRQVRGELLEDGVRESVGDIAYRWGFGNLGRFARDYRERFGELPSQTRAGPSSVRIRAAG